MCWTSQVSVYKQYYTDNKHFTVSCYDLSSVKRAYEERGNFLMIFFYNKL